MTKYLLLMVFICCLCLLQAQDESDHLLNYDSKDFLLSRSMTRDPGLLSNALTKNKRGDKEKFDAIFAWVAKNIVYDFSTYYSSNGSGRTNFKKLLREKKGICVDYASLMDTLCSIAGLLNVSIVGYAKDEIFDINDSIYVDNHAWNAVKLDGLWYVYDVTWASGDINIRYTPFSRFLIKLASKFPIEYRQKKIKRKKRIFVVDDCGNTFSTPSVYYKEKTFNKLMRKIIGLFRLKVEEYYTKRINSDFYLTDPEIFAITHFPDNPIWSLTSHTMMRDFEKDSAFYHLDSFFYLNQNRRGVACPECDYNNSLDELNKQHYLRKKSYAFNKHNRFVTSICEYRIAEINFKNSFEIVDSLSKVNNLDTCIVYLQQAKSSLKIGFKYVDDDFILQKNKNKRKQMMLLEENKRHLTFVKEKINITLAQKRNVKSLVTKSEVIRRKYRRNRTSNLKRKVLPNVSSKLSDKMREDLIEDHNRKKEEIDSLNVMIENYKNKFDSVIINLSLNVWQKVVYHDSLILPILESTQLRRFLEDNMKKPVVEIRRQIPIYERNYASDVNDIVYSPAKILVDLGSDLFNLIDIRNHYEYDLYHAKLLLVKFNAFPQAELDGFRKTMLAESKLDYCWLNGKIPSIKTIFQGFKSLKEKQITALNIIIRENEIERRRTHYVSKDLLRRKKKYRRIIINNAIVTNAKLIEVKKNKRDYLNALKKERRKAGRKITT